jgi:hypothetical protein
MSTTAAGNKSVVAAAAEAAGLKEAVAAAVLRVLDIYRL